MDPFLKKSQITKTDRSNEEDNTPLKIFTIRKQNPKSIYELKSEELRRWLRPIYDYEVAVIPIVGPSRKGKSFMLNYMCRYLANSRKSDWLGKKNTPLKGFHWKSETLPQTDGIWISKPYILEKSNGKQIAVLLLDTQGVFDQHTNKRDWSTIFGLSLLISSCLIFNLQEKLQDDSLIFLESFLEYGLRASRSLTNMQEEKPFQNMVFLIRDWCLLNKHKYGLSGGKEYLNDKLIIQENQDESAQNSRKLLKDCFSEVDCFLMPKLGEGSDEPGFDGSVGQLSPDFSRKLKELVVHILNPDEIKAKKVSDKPITGAEVCQLMESFVNVFNSSEFDEPSPKELLRAYSRISDQINLRRNKILHLSLLENIVQSKPFLGRNDMVERCGRINDEISNIFHEELTTNDENKWEFIREMEAYFDDNFYKVYTQNEIRRKEYITKGIEECKQLFVELTQKDSEQTKSLNLLAFDEFLKECEKTVCERFESYYMGEEKNLFLKDLIELKDVMNTRKEILRQIQIKELDEMEDIKASIVERCIQKYATELQNLLDTNTFIESHMFKVFEEKIRVDTIETFKENFKFENTRNNKFFHLDLEKNIKEKKKHFKKLNEKKCQEIIENTEELLRKAVTEYEKNITQWVDVCDTTQDLLKRHYMAKNDSTEHFINMCLYKEESFLKPFLNGLDNEMIKLHNHFESVVKLKNSIYENALHLSLYIYQNQLKSVLEKSIHLNENKLEKSNKNWTKEAKFFYVEQFKTSNPSQNLYYRYQNELNIKMEEIFDNFVEEIKDRKKQMETKIYTISQKMLIKLIIKLKNVIQYVINEEELNYKFQEIKEELLNDFVEKLEFTDESLLESNKNDLNKLMDIEFDKIKNDLNLINTNEILIDFIDKYLRSIYDHEKKKYFVEQISSTALIKLMKIIFKLFICANYNEATKDADKMVGLEEIRIINEPTAATFGGGAAGGCADDGGATALGGAGRAAGGDNADEADGAGADDSGVNASGTVTGGVALGVTYSRYWVAIRESRKVLFNDIAGRTIRDDEKVVYDAGNEETFEYPRNSILTAKGLIGYTKIITIKLLDDVIQNILNECIHKVIDDGIDNPQIKTLVKSTEKKIFYAEHIASIVLKKLKEIAQKHLESEVIKTVITVPVYFYEDQNKPTKDVGRMPGLNVMRIINEPTATAIAYILNWSINSEASNVLIYDFGGGTFDVAVLGTSKGEIDVRAVGGDNNLGGDVYDINLINFEINQFWKLFKREMVGDEKGKCKNKLSGVEKTKVTIRNLYENHNLDMSLIQQSLKKLLKHMIWTDIVLISSTRLLFYKSSLIPNMKNTMSQLSLQKTYIISSPNVSKLLDSNETENLKNENIFKRKYEEIFLEVREIGAGGFGEVFEVKQKGTNHLYAIKRVELKSDLDLNEIKIMSKLDSDFVVLYIDSWIEEKVLYTQTKKNLFIQMEFCSMNLKHFIDLLKQITNESLQTFNYFISFKIFKELIECVNYLHSINIIHRDLKPENILISNGINGRLLKLCDFGLAKVHKMSVHTRMVGTLQYMAPEVINSNNYNTKSDIYSLALIGTEIFLFEDNINIVRSHKTFRDFNKYQTKYLKTILAKKFKQLLEIFSNCLLPENYNLRPDCKKLLKTINKLSVDKKIVSNDQNGSRFQSFLENINQMFSNQTLN